MTVDMDGAIDRALTHTQTFVDICILQQEISSYHSVCAWNSMRWIHLHLTRPSKIIGGEQKKKLKTKTVSRRAWKKNEIEYSLRHAWFIQFCFLIVRSVWRFHILNQWRAKQVEIGIYIKIIRIDTHNNANCANITEIEYSIPSECPHWLIYSDRRTKNAWKSEK